MTASSHTIPLIGITTTVKDGMLGVRRQYAASVSRAGGMPVLLPIDAAPEQIRAYGSLLDGLLLTGGHDVEPARYGAATSSACGELFPERDAAEWRWLEMAERRRLPVFGICRGMQLMNVFRGGTLVQDIPDELGIELERHQQVAAYEVLTHSVDVVRETRLAHLLPLEGPTLGVNSMHHQAVKTLGRGLVVNARSSEDGIVEAFDDPREPFFFAVQWHPEMLAETQAAAARLFEAFVGAAAACRSNR